MTTTVQDSELFRSAIRAVAQGTRRRCGAGPVLAGRCWPAGADRDEADGHGAVHSHHRPFGMGA